MAPQLIAWDYQFAPNAQKARNLCAAAGIPFKQCEQPFVIPRPALTDLGINYRRVPVWSIGKDFYCDNRVFLEAIQSLFPDKALPTTPADHAYEAFGYRSFWVALPLVPADFVTEGLAKDRKNLFPVFARPDFASLRQSSLAEMRMHLDAVENEFLGHGKQWIAGDKCGVADIHAMWIIKWLFQTLKLGEEPGFSKEDYPRVYKWFEGLPGHDQKDEQLTAEEASKVVLESPYAAPDVGVDPKDPTGFKKGDQVAIEMTDAEPGTYPQPGKLVGLNRKEMVVELENGIRVHFPRILYQIKKT